VPSQFCRAVYLRYDLPPRATVIHQLEGDEFEGLTVVEQFYALAL
jgi:hypothetical protein